MSPWSAQPLERSSLEAAHAHTLGHPWLYLATARLPNATPLPFHLADDPRTLVPGEEQRLPGLLPLSSCASPQPCTAAFLPSPPAWKRLLRRSPPPGPLTHAPPAPGCGVCRGPEPSLPLRRSRCSHHLSIDRQRQQLPFQSLILLRALLTPPRNLGDISS